MQDNSNLGDDLLVGVPAIAAYLGVTARQAGYWIEQGVVRTFRIRKLHAARRSQLDADLRAPDTKPDEAA